MYRQISGARMWAWLGLLFEIGLAGLAAQNPPAANGVNPGAALTQDFQQRVAGYMKLRKDAEAKLAQLKKPTESPSRIQHYRHELREAIVRRRPDAAQGNIFTPPISAEFRRLVRLAYQADAGKIRESLLHAEPDTKHLHVRVNKSYPANVPLQTTPPSLLLNLPPLPPDLEYRIVGRDLLLRDVEANLIVDMVTGVIPE